MYLLVKYMPIFSKNRKLSDLYIIFSFNKTTTDCQHINTYQGKVRKQTKLSRIINVLGYGIFNRYLMPNIYEYAISP